MRMKYPNLKSLSHPFNFYHEFFIPFISSTNLKFIFYSVNSPENNAPVNEPSKKAIEKYKHMSLFSRFAVIYLNRYVA